MLQMLKDFSFLSVLRLPCPLYFSDLMHLASFIIYVAIIVYILLVVEHEIHPWFPPIFKIGIVLE
jgi:hypothetical protein